MGYSLPTMDLLTLIKNAITVIINLFALWGPDFDTKIEVPKVSNIDINRKKQVSPLFCADIISLCVFL